MKTRIALFALALAALPFAAQSASAQGYYDRLTATKPASLATTIASGMKGPTSPATGARCRGKGASAITPPSVSARPLWHGNFGAARTFDLRRRHEQAEINAERRDIARDRQPSRLRAVPPRYRHRAPQP